MLTDILVENCVGETRAAGFDGEGRACALYLDRWAERGRIARWGSRHPARLTRLAAAQGGGFAELDHGQNVFLQARSLKGRTEGERFDIEIVSEARADKLARGRPLQGEGCDEIDPLERWWTSLPRAGGVTPRVVRVGESSLQAAFDEALSQQLVLPGGGKLRLSRTPALTAIDIDTAGRDARGNAYARAEALNVVAAEFAARQLALRGLGGAAVLDCVEPLRRQAGPGIKRAFLQAFRAVSSRTAEALAPSPFGLMEIATSWRERPVADAIMDGAGQLTPLSQLLEIIRAGEREAQAARTARFELKIPAAWAEGLAGEITAYRAALNTRYGARFDIALSQAAEVTEVVRL